MKRFLFLSTALLLMGCNGSKKTSVAMQEEVEHTCIISLKKQGCRGYCPRYTMQLFDDGLLTFSGTAHVAMVGEAERQLSAREMQSVKTLLSTSSFYSLDDLYDNTIVDIPFHTMDVNYQGKSKTVKSRGDKPAAYQELETLMERLAQKEAWLTEKKEAEGELSQLIIELSNPDLVAILEERYTDFNLALNRRISPRQLYFLFDVKNKSRDREEVLSTIQDDPDVKSVQWNRSINRRK